MSEVKYQSERGHALVTQNLHSDMDGNPVGMLTVEDYCKWYRAYIIRPDGTVEGIHEMVCDDRDEYGWRDHAIIPYAFHETAKNLGLEYDDKTFAKVCERFVEDILDDWTTLYNYLPLDKKGKILIGELCKCGNKTINRNMRICQECFDRTLASLRDYEGDDE
jgi:hypothetical protein